MQSILTMLLRMKKFIGSVTDGSSLAHASRVLPFVDASQKMDYEAAVIGVSSGGMDALSVLLPRLSERHCRLSILIVQHLHPHSEHYLPQHLDSLCELPVKEADEKDMLRPGMVYIAPANYHLLVEADKTLSLSTSPKVNYARPSIDVLFETAAEVFRESLVGIILTGANTDGSLGLKRIKEYGGLAIVQDPQHAEAPSMPCAAIRTTAVDYVLPLFEIGTLLNDINRHEGIYETTAVSSCY
jgi:two-component system chemotaxis response regulator CheB